MAQSTNWVLYGAPSDECKRNHTWLYGECVQPSECLSLHLWSEGTAMYLLGLAFMLCSLWHLPWELFSPGWGLGLQQSSPKRAGGMGGKAFSPVHAKTISLPNCKGESCCSMLLGVILSPREHLAMSEDIFGYHNWGEDCYSHLVSRSRGCW